MKGICHKCGMFKEVRHYFPFITKEGEYFKIGQKIGNSPSGNKILLSKIELKRLKRKLNEIDIDKFFWKQEI